MSHYQVVMNIRVYFEMIKSYPIDGVEPELIVWQLEKRFNRCIVVVGI